MWHVRERKLIHDSYFFWMSVLVAVGAVGGGLFCCLFTIVYSMDLFASYDSSSSRGMMYPMNRAAFASGDNLRLACDDTPVLNGVIRFIPRNGGTMLALSNTPLSLSNLRESTVSTPDNLAATNIIPNRLAAALGMSLGVRNSGISFRKASGGRNHILACGKRTAPDNVGLSIGIAVPAVKLTNAS